LHDTLNIGEAANKLSKSLKDKYNTIPWHNYVGFRNIAAHNYEALKIERVWNTCKNVMPKFKEDVKCILIRNLAIKSNYLTLKAIPSNKKNH